MISVNQGIRTSVPENVKKEGDHDSHQEGTLEWGG